VLQRGRDAERAGGRERSEGRDRESATTAHDHLCNRPAVPGQCIQCGDGVKKYHYMQ
jgi:hypothetical protein